MALSTISGTTGITDATITSAKLADFAAAVDLNGVELLLDADQDTSITADTDDRIDFKIAGVEHFSFSNSSGDTVIKPMVDAKDIKLQQFDGRTLLDINDGGFIGVGNGATGPGVIRILEDTDNGTNYVGLSVGNVSTAYTLVFPNADGSSGQALTTNGSGVLSFTTLSANTPSSADGQALGSASLEWSDLFLADASTIQFGADQDVILTHVADTGLLLSGTNVIQFNDASQNIGAPSNAILDINATDEIELNATLVDVNANLDVSGTITSGGVITGTAFTAGSAVLAEAELELLDGLTAGTAIASKVVTTDASIDTSGQRNLTISGELDAATGDFSGVVDIAGATTTAAITASGILKTDDTTAATSTTDGSLQTDGGLSVAGDAIIGDDVTLISDAAVLSFGANAEVSLTHVHDTGILLNSTNVIQFNDASQSIGAPSNAILDINATDEIELNATLVDINANVEISGTAVTTGVHTFTAVPVFPNNTIETADIQADAIDGTKIADDAINSEHYTDGSIDTAHIAADQITNAKIADDQIDSEHYVDGSIDTAHIAADQITNAKIADDQIDSEHYVDGSIDTAHIAADQITNAKIADDQIDSEHYVDGSIDTAHIADNQITLAKMAGGTDGNIISYDASGDPVAIATGSDGQVLTSTGAGSAPAFEALPASGKIGQVLQKYKTDSFNTTSTSYTEISSFRQALTPSASNSKIMIWLNLGVGMAATGTYWIKLIRIVGSTHTNIAFNTIDGNEDAAWGSGMRGTNPDYELQSVSLTFLDAPATTAEVTFYVSVRCDSSTLYIGQIGANASRATTSVMTLMEVLA